MSIPNVQLAFQGGGAKFAAMLPVADAFLTFHRKKQVNIKAVAGTSAGAICAALVATEADFDKVRSVLTARGPYWVEQLIPPDVRPLTDSKGELTWWGWFQHRKLLQKILWNGDPILNTQALSDFFTELFKAARKGNQNNLKIDPTQEPRLTIIASDIAASEPVIHQSGPLIPALVDSCALPIILRSFNTLFKTHFVDGGLCDNLPVEGLLADVEAPVFAVYPISPKKEQSGKNNIVTYLLALLSASINHGTARSQAMISEPFRFEVETGLELLDFNDAIAKLADEDWYNEQRTKALWRVENFLNVYGLISTPSAARVIDVVDVAQYRKSLMDLTNGFERDFEFQQANFHVRVNCDQIFLEQKEAEQRKADTVTRTMRLKVVGDDVRFYRSNLTLVGKSIVPTVWTVKNLTRETDVPIRALALEDRLHKGRTFKHCLIQFLEPEESFAKGDVLEVKGVYPSAVGNDLAKLNFKAADYFGFANAQNPAIARAELVLIYPRVLGELQLLSHPTRSDRQDAAKIAFSEDVRQAVGERFNILGLSLDGLQPEEAFFAQVIAAE